MHIAHDPLFIVLSALTAWLGAWTTLDLFSRVRAHAGGWRAAWLAATAIAMGLSIWSMHFIAMLGFNPGAEVRYDVGLTLLSLLLAIATTAFAFVFARGGTVVGLGARLDGRASVRVRRALGLPAGEMLLRPSTS